MRVLIFCSLFCLISIPAMAQPDFVLEHEVVDLEPIAAGTRITYKLTLSNPSAHQYQSLQLMLENVALTLSPELQLVEFNTLPAGASKHRFITLVSSERMTGLQQPHLLLFHLQARDESGAGMTLLLRSQERQP